MERNKDEKIIVGTWIACSNMFNSEQQSLYSCSMDPRISFSNDFVDTQAAIKFETNYREAPVSSDFEFSVRNYTMIPADEIFCKGVILPLQEKCTNQLRKMTLRDELLVDDNDDPFPTAREQRSTCRWKERLGLKRDHIVTKKADRNHGVLERIMEGKGHVFMHKEELAGRNTGHAKLDSLLSLICIVAIVLSIAGGAD